MSHAGPLVSIIMPVHNSGSYIRESVQSILNQTHNNLELIVVDDLCTDDSISILKTFKDARIKVLHNSTNEGLAASLNKAIRISAGEFIARMDGDDVSRRKRIESQLDYLVANPGIDVLGTAMQYFGHSHYRNFFPATAEACRIQLLFNVCFGHSTVMFRRRVFGDEANFYNEELLQYSEDYDLWCRLAGEFAFANLQEILLDYRTYVPAFKEQAEKQRIQNTTRVQEGYLKSILGKVTEAELETHFKITAMQTLTKDELHLCDQWLSRMIQLNNETNALDRILLPALLAKKFYEICYRNATLGMNLFYESKWSGLYRPSLKSRSFHFLKYMLKR